MSKEEAFINEISTYAQDVQMECGLFASVTIAQACLETGYNMKRPVDVISGEDSFNIFGMKATGTQPYVISITTEVYSTLPSSYISYVRLATGEYQVKVYAKFRKFANIAECFSARALLFKNSKYYAKAITAKTADDAVYYLIHTGHYNDKNKEIGYATDPAYISKVIKLINQYDLKQYDLSEEDIAMINRLEAKVSDLEKRLAALEKTGTATATPPTTTTEQQEVATWAKDAQRFVVTKINGVAISDGTRPKDPVTREEVWTMLSRYHNAYRKTK